jgi:hypothetical protein
MINMELLAWPLLRIPCIRNEGMTTKSQEMKWVEEPKEILKSLERNLRRGKNGQEIPNRSTGGT